MSGKTKRTTLKTGVLLALFWVLENCLFVKRKHDYIVITIKDHCVKSVRIRSYSGTHFPAFGLNTEKPYLSVFSPNT